MCNVYRSEQEKNMPGYRKSMEVAETVLICIIFLIQEDRTMMQLDFVGGFFMSSVSCTGARRKGEQHRNYSVDRG